MDIKSRFYTILQILLHMWLMALLKSTPEYLGSQKCMVITLNVLIFACIYFRESKKDVFRVYLFSRMVVLKKFRVYKFSRIK